MKKARVVFLTATIGMIMFIAGSLFIFGGELSSHKDKDIEQRIQDNVGPNIASFILQMEEQIKKVKTFADFLGKNWNLEERVHVSLLQSAVENNGILRCAIAYPDGSFITHDSKNEGNVSGDAFFEANMRGEFFITDPRPAVVDQRKTVILFSAPIKGEDGTVVGSVIYSYLCNDIDDLFNLESIEGKMDVMVTKQSGELLIGDSPYAQSQENMLYNLSESCTHKKHEEDACAKITKESGTHIVSEEDTKENLYVRYDSLGYNDWYMVTTLPESAAAKSVSFAANNQRLLSILIAGGLLIYFGILSVLFLTQRKLVDVETGACTMAGFKKASKEIFKNCSSKNFVVVLLDVKDFKLINRIHSFEIGDKVIKCIVQALRNVLDDSESIFARVGVDRFLLLLPYHGRNDLDKKRQTFIQYFRKFANKNFTSKIVFPTGQYVLKESDFPKPDMTEIFEKVNFAHRAAKQHSDVIIDYEEDIENTALFEKTVEDRMESAIAEKEFSLYLQPKVRLSNETLCGAEALVRWEIDGTYYMYPTDFVPIMEKNGFIVQLDKYMFRLAVEYVRECMDRGIVPLVISVNFSRHHLNNERFVEELCEIADEYDVPHRYFEVELTESAFLGHVEDIALLIDHMHEAGFAFSMDDFGNGYSCFAQLKELRIDVLKIDKGFFDKSADEGRSRVVVDGVIKIAKELNIKTVAEGIEERAQIEMLKELGCDIVQGYYYAKPMPSEQLDIEHFVVNTSES